MTIEQAMARIGELESINAELRKALAGMLKEYRDLDLPYGSEAYRVGNAAMQSDGEQKWEASPNGGREVRTTKEDREFFAGEQKNG